MLQSEHSAEHSAHSDDYRPSQSERGEGSTAAVQEPSERAPTLYGKASSVASQNLSIIVEAINHLESDKERLSAASSERVSLPLPVHSSFLYLSKCVNQQLIL